MANVNRDAAPSAAGAKIRRLLDWSPHSPNQFVVAAADLRLYELNVFNAAQMKQSGVKKVVVKGINYEVTQIRCVAWSPSTSSEPLVACGLPSGKVVLSTFNGSIRVLKEFGPKHSRACNCLAWNPLQPHLFATGLDKVRSDCSTLIWDVNQQGISSDATSRTTSTPGPAAVQPWNEYSFNLSPTEAAESVSTPINEMANSEATTALAWDPSNPFSLVTGTGVKWLRIYDTRADTNSPQSVVAHSRSVQGVSFDPFRHERLATFSEDGIIKFWDVRNFVEPIFSLLTNSKGLQQVEWCPRRSGVLATSSSLEKTIKFWDIQDAMVGQNKNERDDFSSISTCRPYKTHEGSEAYSSFSWDPLNQHRLLTITNNGILEVVTLQQTTPIKWSPQGRLSFSYGNKQSTLSITPDDNKVPTMNQGKEEDRSFRYASTIFDVSVEMRNRAKLGYSMDIAANKKLVESINGGELVTLWNWMSDYSSGQFVSTKEIQVEMYQGIHSVLQSSTASSKKVNNTPDKTQIFPVITSPQRSVALQICGWGLDKKDSLEQAAHKLESSNQYERAAALCVFHLDLRRAIASLTRGAQQQSSDSKRGSHLRLMAMALAGCNDTALNNGLWREAAMDMAIFNEIKHPYLKACLSFLCNDSRSHRSVLDNHQLSLADRVGFACKFLDDSELMQFVESSIDENQKKGNIEGIILTGLDQRAMEIFEQYVNTTGDVQTAALVVAHLPKKNRDQRVDMWIRSYRELMDVWELWHARARFDIALKDPIAPQVYARCNFCNQALAMSLITGRGGQQRRTPKFTSQSTTNTNHFQKQTSASCPGCKKPLPRCVVCLLPFNVNVPQVGRQNQSAGSSSGFGSWFTWCQSCRHGGHACHMMEWFVNHRECPVADCKCTQCSTLL
ncbi:WD repeat-containing protein mio-like [Planoprotostelium fungivorum]|uniref:WD repeat-containing protein mio-like n=1 Tax=Planoprotostelium fungivorum TaxID=1890364 RepID=A0A2P6NZS7_9EUKA|nr:WD repeat-containing protein mio-like [Planoprotostelium fungivorum]